MIAMPSLPKLPEPSWEIVSAAPIPGTAAWFLNKQGVYEPDPGPVLVLTEHLLNGPHVQRSRVSLAWTDRMGLLLRQSELLLEHPGLKCGGFWPADVSQHDIRTFVRDLIGHDHSDPTT